MKRDSDVKDHEWTLNDTWRQMEAVLATGKVRAIGVSNCSQPYLERLLTTAKIVPAANQIELSPYLPQHKLLAYLKSKGILAQAFSPLGSTDSPLLKDADIVAIAEKHKVGAGTVLISYQVARGVCVLPKSVTPKRIEENLKLIELDDSDMTILNGLGEKHSHRAVRPNWGVDLEFDNW
ncbi:hypothetical protein RQP46_011210 [Phenoliferia psychrophenolica]